MESNSNNIGKREVSLYHHAEKQPLFKLPTLRTVVNINLASLGLYHITMCTQEQ